MRNTSHGPVSVCLSVCVSQVGVLLKRLNTGSHKENNTIAQGFWFFYQRSLQNSTGVTPYGDAKCRRVGQNRRLSTNSWLYLENGRLQDRRMVSITVEVHFALLVISS